MGTSVGFPSHGTELFICSKDFPNVAHHLWNAVILVNGTVLFVVNFSRQLRYPRHIFWAAVSFFEMIFLVQSILEMIVILQPSRLPGVSTLLVILASVDYSVLLIYTTRWLRWIATTWPSPASSGTRRSEKKVTISPIVPSTMETISK
jgi:hypothetical protein